MQGVESHRAAGTPPLSSAQISSASSGAGTLGGGGMLRRFGSPTFFQMASDVLSIAAAFIFFYFLKLSSSQSHPAVGTIEFFVTVLGTSIAFWLIVYWLSGLYKNWYIRSPFDEFFSVLKSSFVAGAIVMLAMYAESGYMRVKFLPYLLLLVSFICTGRLIARRVQRSLRIGGHISLPTLIVGSSQKIRGLLHQVELEPSWGYSVIGAVVEAEALTTTVADCATLGSFSELERIVANTKPDAILLALDSSDHDLMLRIVSLASDHNISVKIEPDLYEIITGQVKTLQIYGSPLIEVNAELLRPWQYAVKRLFDIVFSAAVLLIGMPLWLLLAAIVVLESKGPALFSQPRIGKHGASFRIYKFRSMVVDAEKAGQQWTKVGDPRVTKFGYFLRKSHLDEIPQMWNILIGDMSLVGPRPEQPRYVEMFSESIPYYSRRHKVRPGLTGWWQVKYVSYHESLDEIKDRIRYDFFYIENMSLRLDFEIIVRTVFLMFRGHGQA